MWDNYEEYPRYKFTVDQFHKMGEIGILKPGVRYELLDGQHVYMNPLVDGHDGFVNAMAEWLRQRLPSAGPVLVHTPLALAEHTEFKPDIQAYKPGASEADGAAGVGLLVEVCDLPPAYERSVKTHFYAQAGVPEVWLIEVDKNAVEVRRGPAPGGEYRQGVFCREDCEIALQCFPDARITAREVLDLYRSRNPQTEGNP